MTADVENVGEKSPLLSQNPTNQKLSIGFTAWAVFALVTSTLLVTLTLSYASMNAGGSTQPFTSLAAKGVIRTSGQQPIRNV